MCDALGLKYSGRKSREVAIKMMLKGEFASDVDRQRFQAEAEAAARLNHPNIIPIYEIANIMAALSFA